MLSVLRQGFKCQGKTVRLAYRYLNGKKGKIQSKPLTDKDLRWRASP
jgi:hypothetical protein